MFDDATLSPAAPSDSQVRRGEHEIDMEKWTRAQSAGVATAVIGHIVIFGLFATVIAFSYPEFASDLIHFLLGWAVLGLAFSAHIGTICALGAFFMFRRSTIPMSMMAIVITVIFLASEIGWLIVLSG